MGNNWLMTKPGEVKPVSRQSIIALDLVKKRAPWCMGRVSAYSIEGENACRWLRQLSEAMIMQGMDDLHVKAGCVDGEKINEEEASQRRRNAREWFESDSMEAMTFGACCDTMGLNPDATAEAILDMSPAKCKRVVARYRRTRL